MYDLIVLGGGPAGLTATVYGLRRRLETLLITRDLGGKTNYRLQLPEIEHHLVINGEEVVSRFVNEIEYLDFARRMEKAERVERGPEGWLVHTREGGRYAGRAVIVATGARARLLDVPGEREYMMRGLCYSAVSYAPLFFGRDTVVVGDGALALRATLELARIARYVTLVAPAPAGALRGPLAERLRALPNVLTLAGHRPVRVEGDAYARSMVVEAEGGARSTLRADAFFVEMGLTPNSGPVQGLVDLDAEGRIKVDARNRTSAPGVFAAGDVTNAFAEQALIALGEGAKAALAAYEYLLEQPVEEPAAAGEWR
jgi:alkyl hydroperoxide reductase subunit F